MLRAHLVAAMEQAPGAASVRASEAAVRLLEMVRAPAPQEICMEPSVIPLILRRGVSAPERLPLQMLSRASHSSAVKAKTCQNSASLCQTSMIQSIPRKPPLRLVRRMVRTARGVRAQAVVAAHSSWEFPLPPRTSSTSWTSRQACAMKTAGRVCSRESWRRAFNRSAMVANSR
jgi:hypothetical protein